MSTQNQDTRLLWEQYTSPGRVGGGSVPFPDGRGEVQAPEEEQPNGWTGEGFEELTLAELTDELLRFDASLPEDVKMTDDYKELLYNIKRDLKQHVDELEIKLNG